MLSIIDLHVSELFLKLVSIIPACINLQILITESGCLIFFPENQEV